MSARRGRGRGRAKPRFQVTRIPSLRTISEDITTVNYFAVTPSGIRLTDSYIEITSSECSSKRRRVDTPSQDIAATSATNHHPRGQPSDQQAGSQTTTPRGPPVADYEPPGENGCLNSTVCPIVAPPSPSSPPATTIHQSSTNGKSTPTASGSPGDPTTTEPAKVTSKRARVNRYFSLYIQDLCSLISTRKPREISSTKFPSTSTASSSNCWRGRRRRTYPALVRVATTPRPLSAAANALKVLCYVANA